MLTKAALDALPGLARLPLRGPRASLDDEVPSGEARLGERLYTLSLGGDGKVLELLRQLPRELRQSVRLVLMRKFGPWRGPALFSQAFPSHQQDTEGQAQPAGDEEDGAEDEALAALPSPSGHQAEIARAGAQNGPLTSLSLSAFGAKGPEVQLYDDAASHRAAALLGAHAFSWGGAIFLGDLRLPGAPSRAEAIRHEMIHALQTRRRGPLATAQELEREAHHPATVQPRLAAARNEVLGFWWIVPVAVGLYVLLRPKIANAPGPNDTPQQSPSDAQIVAEALALFAVPAGVTGALGRMGYGVVASYAVGGAVSSVSFRGVQDAGAGRFSGVQAYLIDATTGAVIGLVVGGAVRLVGGAAVAGPRGSSLVHLTDDVGKAGIADTGVLRGSGGIYALPADAANQSTAMRFFRTLVSPSRTRNAIPIPGESSGLFSQPAPIGPVSAYQRLMGVYRAPAGAIDLASGAFTPSGGTLANVAGQFWPYGVDVIIWAGAGTMAATSSADPDAFDRGAFPPVYQFLRDTPPLPARQLTDGPFVFLNSQASSQGGADQGGVCRLPQAQANVCAPEPPPVCLASDPQTGGAPLGRGAQPGGMSQGSEWPSPYPAVIFVVPVRTNDQTR